MCTGEVLSVGLFMSFLTKNIILSSFGGPHLFAAKSVENINDLTNKVH